MAITGLQVIGIGLQNESTNSDSLFTAFNKTKDNLGILANYASPFSSFANGIGILIDANSTSNTVTITNTGVLSLTAGDGSIELTGSNGNITITSTGGGNGGGVTSVGLTPVSSARLTVTNSPIISSGTISIDLAATGVIAGGYTYPSVSVDEYGRITSIANAASVGTVTSIGITPGTGIQVTGSPVTTSGNINITNTGVTRLNAGTGISLSGGNGNVTVSTTITGGTVTGVTVASTTLTVSGSPITTTGTITINLPTTITLTGNITGGNLISTGRITSANATAGIGYATGAGGTITQGTSRTTSVTINKMSGAITLFSAAGTSAYTTFTVTNSTVAATDVIIVNQKSGTDKYQAFVSAVAAGSFAITFSDISGTTTEQQVFNFAVIKAVAA
jgi:hypothetical protein